MSAGYKAIGWNRQKKIYDAVVLGGLLLYLGVFVTAGLTLHPETTIETLLIRAFGTAALLLLHVILVIGPLCRLDRRFLPLLYNRRHLGVITFAMALAHGGFAIVQFHALGDVNPLVSVLVSNPRWDSLAQFPFQPLGLVALAILFLMAATSHDFWLANLTAPTWKRLHMAVYFAYGLIVLHVALGVLQQETAPALAAVLSIGVALVGGLHVVAAVRERRGDRPCADDDGFVDFCALAEVPEDRAAIRSVGGERVAVFRHAGRLSALSNVCQHQNGPLGEGRVVNGCAVCPWHGYEYRLRDGASPPPFTEKVPTFRVRVEGDRVRVDPRPNPPGTEIEPAPVESAAGEPAAAGDGDFYIGYQPRAPAALGRRLRWMVVALLVVAGALPLLLVSSQQEFPRATFEYGTVKQFEGRLAASPYPVLHVDGGDAPQPHYLVEFGKRGARAELEELDGQRVRASGQLIYRGEQRMIELTDDAVEALGRADAAGPPVALGRHALVGEILDSKCYLGVMKPGRGKPHRACATRCISGGVPPILVVTDRAGNQRHLLITGADGEPIGRELLGLVAEPVAVEGEIVVQDGLWRLRAAADDFRRVAGSGGAADE